VEDFAQRPAGSSPNAANDPAGLATRLNGLVGKFKY
jgi:hypothetical protein